MKSITKLLGVLLLLICSFTYGQIEPYKYKREIKGVTGQWHKIILPNEVFAKTANDLGDIRVYGITADNDTLEAPYLLRIATDSVSNKEVPFKMLNFSHDDRGYYFTFEVPTLEPINQINLDLKQSNFDWKIKLEGSQDNNDWYTVLENYRILSIKNKLTDFRFTKLSFPSSKYRFFRLYVDSKEKPELMTARVSQQETSAANYRDYSIKSLKKKDKKDSKQTEIDIEFDTALPVSFVKLEVKNAFDYYRPITIQYLADSVKTEKGWKYNYRTLATGTLNSIEKNEFRFPGKTAQKLKIYIDNQDNQPLSIGTIQVKGYVHELLVRFVEHGSYFLTYGNSKAAKPSYDIGYFSNKVPNTLTALELGAELTTEKGTIHKATPLFKSMTWLWVIMGLIIIVLAGFSIKMMRKE